MFKSPLDERYEQDPDFRTLVDMFRKLFREAQCTPSEARTAVNYAAICEEMSSDRALFFYDPKTGELTRVPR